MRQHTKYFLTGLAYFPLSAVCIFTKMLTGNNLFKLRVLLYHGFSEEHLGNFKRQMLYLKKDWKFLTADEFCEVISGERKLEGNSLLLTFDDGFYSNRVVSEKVLVPLNIPALFFIVSKYVEYTNEDNWRDFVCKNISPLLHPRNVPDYMRNMGWNDLYYLLDVGHAIGAHTGTHKRLSNLHGDELYEEIIKSADFLEERLTIKINHFAFTFGNFESISNEALKIASKRFKYIHTGLRGNNIKYNNPWGILRDSLVPTMPLYSIGGVLAGALDFLYRKKIEHYISWGDLD